LKGANQKKLLQMGEDIAWWWLRLLGLVKTCGLTYGQGR